MAKIIQQTRLIERAKGRRKRKVRIRSKISGTAIRPRISFFRSHRNILVQAIDDIKSITLVSISSNEAEFRNKLINKETCVELGTVFADRMKEKSIETAVFDRNGYKYHGRIAAFVDALREKGIKV